MFTDKGTHFTRAILETKKAVPEELPFKYPLADSNRGQID